MTKENRITRFIDSLPDSGIEYQSDAILFHTLGGDDKGGINNGCMNESLCQRTTNLGTCKNFSSACGGSSNAVGCVNTHMTRKEYEGSTNTLTCL